MVAVLPAVARPRFTCSVALQCSPPSSSRLLIGALVYIIRVKGNYPDAVAFAVLIMNFAAPFIDHYTQPRTYGHAKAKPASEPEGDQ